MGRGMMVNIPQELTDRAKEKFGFELDVTKLRLITYLQYLSINSMTIDPRKINNEERDFFNHLRNVIRVMEGGASSAVIFTSKDFWDFMSDCLYYAYNVG